MTIENTLRLYFDLWNQWEGRKINSPIVGRRSRETPISYGNYHALQKYPRLGSFEMQKLGIAVNEPKAIRRLVYTQFFFFSHPIRDVMVWSLKLRGQGSIGWIVPGPVTIQ